MMKPITQEQVQQVLDSYAALSNDAKADIAHEAYPSAHPDLHPFLGSLESTGFIEPFDWQAWVDAIGEEKVSDTNYVASADLNAIRKLMTAHLRLERFNAGHIQELFTSGYMDSVATRLQNLNTGDSAQPANAQTSGALLFDEIPKLPDDWWLGKPPSDPSIVWTVWQQNIHYLWGANVGNYKQGPIGTLIGGGGMASVRRGPTRGRFHPNYVGVITMDYAQMPNNDAVFIDLQSLAAKGKDVLVPIFHDKAIQSTGYKLSLGTGIGSSQSNWGGIQRYILDKIYTLGLQCGSVKLKSGVYWPDLRQTPVKVYPINALADIKNIVDNVL